MHDSRKTKTPSCRDFHASGMRAPFKMSKLGALSENDVTRYFPERFR